jgi:hypothetical protein
MFFKKGNLVEKFKDSEFAARFGEYLGTYISSSEQVRADLCKQDTGLTAHVYFLNGLHYDDVTDPWFVELNQIARQHGFKRIFRINYVNDY